MSRTSDKTKKKSADEPKNTNKLILPDPDTVLAEVSFVSPKGTKFQIIKTNQRDEYESPPTEKKCSNRNPSED